MTSQDFSVIPGEGGVTLASVIITDALHRRPSRAPDYQAENRALAALAQALANSPQTILQRLAETARELCQAGSAGISLLTEDDGRRRFSWPAISGQWAPHAGGGTPRDFGPCGVVLDTNTVQLFAHPERYYPYLASVSPPIEEALLAPFYLADRAIGTIWVIAHDDRLKFDREHSRQLVSLGTFASAGCRISTAVERAERQAQERHERESPFRTLLETVPVMIWICRPDGFVLHVNRRWIDYTGQSEEEYRGQGWAETMHPADRPRILAQWERCTRTGELYEGEVRYRRVDGQYRWHYFRGVPLRREDGSITAWYGASIDIQDKQEAERALGESEERFAGFMRHLPGLAWIKDADGRYVFANDAAVKVFGAPRERLYGRTDEDLFPPEVAAQFRANDRRALVEGGGTRLVETLEHPDGLHHSLVSKFPIPTPDHRPMVGGIAIDITERKAQEIALRRVHEELQLILDNVPAMIWYKDTHNRILMANRLAAESLGLQKARIEGKSVADLYPEEADRYYQDDLIVIRTGLPRLGIIEPYQSATGEKRWIQTDKVPMKDESGAVTGIIVMAIDITERKRTEQALRESEERLRLATEAGKVGIWDWDIPADQVSWTKSLYTIHGVKPGEVAMTVGGFAALVHPDDRQLVHQAIQTTLQDDTPYELEFRANRPDGAVIWLFTSAVVLREEGRPRRMIGATVDITQSKGAEEKLRAWNTVLEQCVQERTREVTLTKDRLRALATELNLAEQRERKRIAMELHDYLAQLLVVGKLRLAQTKRLAVSAPQCLEQISKTDDILTDALTYTRTLVAELSPPALQEFGLVQALEWLASQMHRHGLAVMVKPNGDLPPIPEDRTVLLFQSVRELLFNVLKHAGANQATVSFIVTPLNELELTVSDDGRGFDPTSLATQDTGSHRFGLFSIRERMAAMGGGFGLQSAPGRGTTARLTLPLKKRSAEPKVLSPEYAEAQQSGHPSHSALRTQDSALGDVRIRVLLVDDHAMVRQGLRSVLEQYDDVTIVGEAADGVEAVAQVEALRPSLVIMDINMPKKNGIEATVEITSRFPDTVVIGLSVQTSAEIVQAMRKAGATAMLTKEGAVDELYLAIQAAWRDAGLS